VLPTPLLVVIYAGFRYADSFYICTIISSAVYATISTVSPERGELLPLEVRTEYNVEDADLLKQSFSDHSFDA
jgi:transcription initiation factor TFIID subunit 2